MLWAMAYLVKTLAPSKLVVSLYGLSMHYKKKSTYKQLECRNNLIKIIKAVACEKSSKSNYYRVAVWEGENCRHSLVLSHSIWHRKT